jgi:hypothetical protein
LEALRTASSGECEAKFSDPDLWRLVTTDMGAVCGTASNANAAILCSSSTAVLSGFSDSGSEVGDFLVYDRQVALPVLAGSAAASRRDVDPGPQRFISSGGHSTTRPVRS